MDRFPLINKLLVKWYVVGTLGTSVERSLGKFLRGCIGFKGFGFYLVYGVGIN